MDTPPPGAASRPPRRWRLAAWLVTLAIVAACVLARPGPHGTQGLPLDKLGHASAFLACAFCWRRGGLGAGGTLGLCAALALGTEAFQGLFLPTRSAEWGDLAADALGALAGWGLAALLPSPGASVPRRATGASGPLAWLRRTLARLLYGRRAVRALATARADLARSTLPEVIAARERLPVAARRRPLALRALASALRQRQAREGDPAPCLPRAVALLGEARALGFAPRLMLGARGPGEAFGAHAWLELDGRPFLEDPRTPEHFAAFELDPPASQAPAGTPRPRRQD